MQSCGLQCLLHVREGTSKLPVLACRRVGVRDLTCSLGLIVAYLQFFDLRFIIIGAPLHLFTIYYLQIISFVGFSLKIHGYCDIF